MTVRNKKTPKDDKNVTSGDAVYQPNVQLQAQPQPQAMTARAGKEQDVLYQEQAKLLSEVQEKYKEADHEVEEKVKEAIGQVARVRGDIKIPEDVAKHGVKSRDQEASEVLRNDGTLEVLTSQEQLNRGLKTGPGGRRLIDKTIVGVKSFVGWAIRLGRLIKEAHKNAHRVIFKKKGDNNLV